jgi:hypothetical protein
MTTKGLWYDSKLQKLELDRLSLGVRLAAFTSGKLGNQSNALPTLIKTREDCEKQNIPVETVSELNKRLATGVKGR